MKKLFTAAATLAAVSVLVFFAFAVIPGDPALKKLGTQATPEALENLREKMGLNGSVFVRYFKWISGYITGDPGMSYSYDMPVSELLSDKLPVTISLVAMASKKAVDSGIYCGNIIKFAASMCGGGGGGRPDMAQAGGKDPSAIDGMLEKIPEEAAKNLKK